MDTLDKQLEICGKRVFIIQNHERALKAWSAVRVSLPSAPLLITLDFHTDTHPAFARYLSKENPITYFDVYDNLSNNLVRKIDFNRSETVEEAITKLHNDEQINTAIRADIISQAFVIYYDNASPTLSVEEKEYNEHVLPHIMRQVQEAEAGKTPLELPPRPTQPLTYSEPSDKIFHIPRECATNCNRENHGDECTRLHCDQAIEADYLRRKLTIINTMAKSIGVTDILNERYILDFDLDYFRTKKAVYPIDLCVIHLMIARSIAITVAMEPDIVKNNRLSGESIDSDMLLDALLEHIRNAEKSSG
jgi:hypothetical protein